MLADQRGSLPPRPTQRRGKLEAGHPDRRRVCIVQRIHGGLEVEDVAQVGARQVEPTRGRGQARELVFVQHLLQNLVTKGAVQLAHQLHHPTVHMIDQPLRGNHSGDQGGRTVGSIGAIDGGEQRGEPHGPATGRRTGRRLRRPRGKNRGRHVIMLLLEVSSHKRSRKCVRNLKTSNHPTDRTIRNQNPVKPTGTQKFGTTARETNHET